MRKKWNRNTGLYIMEYYSAITKNEIMPLVAIWMDLRLSH